MGSPTPKPKPLAPVVKESGLWAKHADGLKWTKITAAALDVYGVDLLKTDPKDAEDFCPNFVNLDANQRKAFWIYLISGIAARESSFKTKDHFKEKMLDKYNCPVISAGLLQLSVGSVRSYDCEAAIMEDLFNPRVNLECGVRIFNRLIARDGFISGHEVITKEGDKKSDRWLGAGRYWHTLRDVSKSRKWIIDRLQSLKMCIKPKPTPTPTPKPGTTPAPGSSPDPKPSPDAKSLPTPKPSPTPKASPKPASTPKASPTPKSKVNSKPLKPAVKATPTPKPKSVKPAKTKSKPPKASPTPKAHHA